MADVHDIPLVYSGMTRQAYHLAERAHRGQMRKAHDIPYVFHPIVVAQIATVCVPGDLELLWACLLHDVPEDTDYTLQDIADEFTPRTARLVAGVTKDSHAEDGRKYSSDEKSRMTEEKMQVCPLDEAATKGCDWLANISDLVFDFKNLGGYEHWQDVFGAKAPKKVAHYVRLGEILIERLAADPTYQLLAEHMQIRLDSFKRLVDAWPLIADQPAA